MTLFLRDKKWLLYPLFLIFPSLIWICLDRTVWEWDQAWYGEVSLRLYDTLRHHPADWLTALRGTLNGAKSPGLPWLAQFLVPLGNKTGHMESALLLLITICQFATLALTYRIAAILWPQSRQLRLAGVALMAGAPLFVGLSQQFFVEPGQALIITWFFYILVRSRDWDLLEWLAHFFGACVFGILAKISTPAYVLVPALLSVAIIAQRLWFKKAFTGLPRRRRIILIVALVALILPAAMETWWYVYNWDAVLLHARQSTSGPRALDYGHTGPLLRKAAFWLSCIANDFTASPLTLAAYFLPALALGIRAFRRSRLSHADYVAAAAALQALVILLILSVSVNEDLRFLFGMLVPLVITVMWAIAQIPGRIFATLVLVGGLSQWAYSAAIGFGFVSCPVATSRFLYAADRDAQHYREITRIIEQTSSPKLANRYNMVGIDLPWFNANSIEFFAAKRQQYVGYWSYYMSLGYAQSQEEDAWHRIFDNRCAYYIMVEPPEDAPRTDFLNRVTTQIFKRISQDPRFVRQPFDSKNRVVIFRIPESSP